jgi:hypothetical protein
MALKQNVSAQEVCDLLNEMLKVDYSCTSALFSHREKCNKDMADHPTIQVRQYPDDEYSSVGILGILNGLFGIREDGMGAICMEVEDEKILGFKLTPKKEDV